MRVMMRSYMTTADGAEYKPGDVAEFDDAECERLVDLGGARHVTAADDAAIAAAVEKAAADKAAAEQLAADKAAAEAAAADKAAAALAAAEKANAEAAEKAAAETAAAAAAAKSKK